MPDPDKFEYLHEKKRDQSGRIVSDRMIDAGGILQRETFFDENGRTVEMIDYDKDKLHQRTVYEYAHDGKALRHTVYDSDGEVIYVLENGKPPQISAKWQGGKPYTIATRPNR